MKSSGQAVLNEIDLSVILRQIMAARRLSVAQMAAAAGVSKSAMEKYLAGPSSPRLVSLVSLSKALNLSLDRIVFGELDPHEELLFSIAFQQFMSLIQDLRTDADLSEPFASLDPTSKAFSDFARDLAYVRAVRTRVTFAAERRNALFQGMKIVTG